MQTTAVLAKQMEKLISLADQKLLWCDVKWEVICLKNSSTSLHPITFTLNCKLHLKKSLQSAEQMKDKGLT